MNVEIAAHRGASRDAPENTMASVRLAWQRGADAVEVDIYQSLDGRVVAIHDGNLKRLAGLDRKVGELTLAELQALEVGSWKGPEWRGERIPLLEWILAIIPDGRRMLVEIKTGPEIVPELARLVEASGKAPAQIGFISFNLDSCREVKQRLAAHQVYYLSGFKQDKETKEWSPLAEDLIRKATDAGLDGLDVHFGGPIDRHFVAKVKAAGLGMLVWTVNKPEDARRMVEAGVEGITTDRPAFLREELR